MQHERHEPPRRRGWLPDAMTDVASAWTGLATDMAGAFDSFLSTMTDTPSVSRRPHRRPERAHQSRCEECRTDRCHCDCCVYDADLVVYARYGERRVVPIRITNERTRTRHITLELSEFTTSGGSPSPATGTIVTRTEFDLEACEREDTVLVIGVAGKMGAVTIKETTALRESLAKVEAAANQVDVELPDVDDCHVAYADLRIQGCDIRPLRLAVAVLPRDCDAHEVHCSCGCC